MKYIKVVLFILLIMVALAFAISNRDFVAVDLFPLPLKVYVPLSILVIFSFACGAIYSSARAFFINLHKNKTNRLNQQKIKALENEIDGMKTDKKIKASL